jgi:hypothetical protein
VRTSHVDANEEPYFAFRNANGISSLHCDLRPWLGAGQESPPSKKSARITAEALRPGSTIRYGQRQGKLIKEIKAIFNPLPDTCQILLLESLESTGTSGAGEPLNDAEVLIQYGDSILYDYAKEGTKQPKGNGAHFYIDDYLKLQDLGHDGVPEVLFHSGTVGASDSATLEHILYYDNLDNSFVDVSPASFYRSGRHGFAWSSSHSTTFAVVADESWPSAIHVEDRCHYCPSPFRYNVYRWTGEKATFELSLSLFGQKSYSEAQEALHGDWTLIQARIEKVR